ncbi:MAG: hypothetical protein JWM91_3158 [Rhodospirillales bacterium]|nr:hypothetical protein [Rhodospirillales bacterium]
MTTSEVAAYVDATGIVLNLDLPPEYRAGVVANLERLFQLGDEVMSFPLPDDTEVAPVFRP